MEVLEKAIERALDGGWDMFGWKPALVSWSIRKSDGALRVKTRVGSNPPSVQTIVYSLEAVIFDHSFAKALWPRSDNLSKTALGSGYQYHLQQLAISTDRLKYLSEFMEGK